MKKKKVLYFMPDNVFWSQAGNLTRTRQLLSYFQKNKDKIETHFLSAKGWDKKSERVFQENYPNIKLFIEDLKGSKKNRFKYLFQDKLPKMIDKLFSPKILNLITPSFKARFSKLVQQYDYDIILVSYASWGRMVDLNMDIRGYKIIDTHDFITLQFEKQYEKQVGKAFQEEMEVLSMYDEIWTYSIEEEYVFSQFTNKKVTLIPVTFTDNTQNTSNSVQYDVIYVASDNPHNVRSAIWLINEVLPHAKDIRVHIIGKVCEVLPDHPQIVKLGIVNDLDAVYRSAQITICPMLTGTGIKIKVLESLSYGLPVVTTRRGIDGLVNKVQNGCLVAEDAKDFAEQMQQLLVDKSLLADKQKEAVSFYKSYYTPEKEMKIFDDIFLGNG